MGSWRLLFFLCVILIYCDLITAQMYNCRGANYTRDSSFSVNVNLLLSSLSSHAIPNNKFYNTTIGQSPPDKAYGLYLCRGDVTAKACKDCVEDASKAIIQRCPTQIESIVVYEMCILRYANRSIFSNMEIQPSWCMSNPNNISNPDQFNEILNRLMDGLVTRATNGSSTNSFATDDANYINFPKIYGLVQCTPDISGPDCYRCLRIAVDQIPNCSNGTAGGRFIQPSCNIRFEVYPFYESSPPPFASPQLLPPPPSLPPPTITNSKGNSFPIIVVIVVPSVVAVALLSTTIVCYCSRKRKAKEIVNNGEEITSVDSLQFEFDTIEAATNDFSDANKLGKGGFGAVYKGRLSDGQEIAVKRLSRNSGQGEEQFKNEVLLVAKLQHRNLVKLLGFCIEGEERLLIYEFVPNTSLDHFIFDPTKRASLNWEMRYKIIGGIARGLLYLHEDSRHRIVHRDLKVSNILLDAEMNPKIADFGLARLCVMDQTEGKTNRIVGTYGYMSPEYAMHGKFSVKSDVYSFGVLLLETVSGQRNNSFQESEHFENLLSYAWRHWMEGTPLELIDPTLRHSFSTSEVMRCIHIGLLCVQEGVADRPTMATVVLMLSSYSASLSLPLPPAFCVHGRMKSKMPTSDLSLPSSVNEVTNTELYPR